MRPHSGGKRRALAGALFRMGGGCAAAAFLAACASSPLYAPGRMAAGIDRAVDLSPPDQTGTGAGYWRVESGIELYHFADGVGEPVLVIHGGPGAPVPGPWKGLEEIDGFQFHYYHQRGCGKSTVPIDRFTSGDYYRNMMDLDRALGMTAQIADIERIRRILGVEKLTLIGHSYGGFISTLYALEFPARVKKMVLVSPASVLKLPSTTGGMDRIRDFLPEDAKRRYDEFIKEYFDYGRIFTRTEDELERINVTYEQLYLEAQKTRGITVPDSVLFVDRPGGWMVHGMYMSLGSEYDYRGLLKNITAPVLVLHGMKDLYPVEASGEYSDNIPGSRLVVLEGSGHFCYDEQPEEFARVVGGFLRE